jgi:drug/metabolite transporter (DMT)-like permease
MTPDARRPRMANGRGWGLALGLFAAMVLVWGLNYLVVRIGLSVAPPLWLAAARSATGAIGVAAFALGTRRFGALPAQGRLEALLIGVPNTGLFFGLWFIAAREIPPGETAVLIYTFPLWVSALSAATGSERLGWTAAAALGVGFAGVVLLSQPWSGGPHVPLVSVFEALAGAASWAVGTLLFKRRFGGANVVEANLWQLTGGAATLFVLAAWTEAPVFQVGPLLLGSVLWLGLVGTAFAYLVWFWLLDQRAASELSAYVFLVPVLALAVSLAAGFERVDAIEVAGIALVLGSLVLTLRTTRGVPVPRTARN